jgi:hypothetical protein
MIALALVALLQGGSVAFPPSDTSAQALRLPAPVQSGLGSCRDPWGESPGVTGRVRRVHPDVLRERFAPSIVQRDWGTAVAGYAAQIDSALRQLSDAPSAEFVRLRLALDTASRAVVRGAIPLLSGPRERWAGGLADLEINQFRPVTSAANRLVFLQSQQHPMGVVLDTTALAADERRAICWSAWSLHRLLQNVNFETIPEALVRIEALTRRWERYRANGPMQLPHELVLNRVKRAVLPARGRDRFNPPRLELVALHPFAGLELTRTDGRVRRTESMAVEVGGATLWLNDWRQHIGASWVLAYDADGRLGRGAVARLGGYVTAGWLRRRDDEGTARSSLLLVVDALRLLRSDAAPQSLRQVQGVAGEVLGRIP